MAYKKPTIEEKKPVTDDFYIAPTQDVLRAMYDKYANFKPYYFTTYLEEKPIEVLITAQDLFLNYEKKVVTFVPGYGFSIFDDGTGDFIFKYIRATKDWQAYCNYQIRREIASKNNQPLI